MKQKGKKLISLAAALAVTSQLLGAMTVSTYAAAYDELGRYTPFAAWGGRASNAAMAAIGDKMYAYVGRMTDSVASGGLTVLDVTDPVSPVEVQSVGSESIDMGDSLPTNEKVCVKDGYLIVRDKTDSAVEVYNINKDNGNIDANYPVAQLKDGFSSGQASMKLYGDYLFVVGRNASKSLRIYDVANPAQIKEITPLSTAVSPAMINEVSEQIATFTADYYDMGNGTFRMYSTNRVKDQGVDMYMLAIRDITIADGKYTAEALYQGLPVGTAFDNGNSGFIYDVDVVNKDTIVVADGSNANEVNSLELIDVSDPANPVHMAYSGENCRAIAVCVDENYIISGTQDSKMYVYEVKENTESENTVYSLELIKQLATPNPQSYEIGVYSEFIYAANNNSLLTYEYKYGVSVNADAVDEIGASITGMVEGYIPGDIVKVNVDGTDYTAEVKANRFSVEITKRLTGNTVDVTASHIRASQILGTDTKTLDVVSFGNTVYNDISDLTLLNSAEHLTGGRATDVLGLTVNDRKLAYLYTVNGLVVYDITDGIEEVQRVTTIGGKIFNGQMQIKDGYLIVLNALQENKVQFYKIGSDGLIADTPAYTVGSGNSAKESTIEIADDYLFEAMQGTSGKQLNVYDISDIESGVAKIGNTQSDVGVHALEIQKLSDTLYRLYYVARSDANNWRFCINDMTRSDDGTLSFDEKYSDLSISSNYSTIADIEYIGDNKIFAAFKYPNVNKSYIIDMSDSSAPTATEIDGLSLSAGNLGDNYYAVGLQSGTVNIYNKQSNEIVKSLKCSGQIYNMSKYDGKLLIASDAAINIYDNLYTKISINIDELKLASEVTLTGYAEGYKPGDSVKAAISDSIIPAAVDANGKFTFTFNPQGTGVLTVSAMLYREDKKILSVTQEVKIVDPYENLPERVYDTNMTVLSSTSNALWGASNRNASVVACEINGRDYAYTGSLNNLIVYDITDPENVSLVQENSISVLDGSYYPKNLAVFGRYIFTGNTADKTVDVYRLEDNGSLESTPVKSLNAGLISGMTIVDNYLFVSCMSASGIIVYDVSDINNIKEIGRQTVPTQTRALLVDKLTDKSYRTYFVERNVGNWYLGIYDAAIADGAAVFTQRYTGTPAEQAIDSFVKDIEKADSDTIVIANMKTDPVGSLEFYNVANPESPTLEFSKESSRANAVLAVSDEYTAVGTPDGRAILYSRPENKEIKTNSLGLGNIYQIAEYKGNLLLNCQSGLVIASMVTEVVVDGTTVSGANPSFSGTVNGYRSGDSLKAVIDGNETDVTVSNGKFTVSLAGAFENSNTAGVHLILERNAEPIAAKYSLISYLGEYPYEITAVDIADGIKVTYDKLNPGYSDAVTVYAAVYEGGKLISVDLKNNVTAGDTWTTALTDFDSQTQTIKVFVWTSDLKPAAEPYSPIIAEVSQNF